MKEKGYDPDQPLVSVIVITYNHARYLAQCLDGILAQQVNFPYEIILHDDASTDGTTALVREYAEKYPAVIKPIIQAENQYRWRGRISRIVYGKVRGRYIATCEGDDFWIDPLKLQKQVDLLEGNAAVAACFTNAYNERDGQRTEYLDGQYTKAPGGPLVTQTELMDAQGLPACTVVFRSTAVLPMPACMGKAPIGDTLLYVHASNHGPFAYIPDFTGVRHMHVGGVYSLKNDADKAWVVLRTLPYLDEVSHYKHHELIEARHKRIVLGSWETALEAGHGELARYCWKELAKMREKAGWSVPVTVRNYLKAYWPRTEKWIGGLRDRFRAR